MQLTVRQLGLIFLIVMIVVIGAVFAKKIKSNNAEPVRQAVFLTNGQVYFGYTKNEDSDTVVINDVYYLQAQPGQQEDSQLLKSQSQVALVKLGNELHGPENSIRINRDHILFIEDMKSDAKVNQAIKNAKSAESATPTPSPSPSQ